MHFLISERYKMRVRKQNQSIYLFILFITERTVKKPPGGGGCHVVLIIAIILQYLMNLVPVCSGKSFPDSR